MIAQGILAVAILLTYTAVVAYFIHTPTGRQIVNAVRDRADRALGLPPKPDRVAELERDLAEPLVAVVDAAEREATRTYYLEHPEQQPAAPRGEFRPVVTGDGTEFERQPAIDCTDCDWICETSFADRTERWMRGNPCTKHDNRRLA